MCGECIGSSHFLSSSQNHKQHHHRHHHYSVPAVFGELYLYRSSNCGISARRELLLACRWKYWAQRTFVGLDHDYRNEMEKSRDSSPALPGSKLVPSAPSHYLITPPISNVETLHYRVSYPLLGIHSFLTFK